MCSRFLVVMVLIFLPTAVALGQPKNPYRKVTTIAGRGDVGPSVEKGRALEMPLSNPFGIQPEADGSLIIASFDQHVVYRLDASYGRLERIAGLGTAGFSGRDGEHSTKVTLHQPHEVALDHRGNIYIADTRNHRVGMIDARTWRWKTIAGTGQKGFSGDDGLAAEAMLNQAYSIAVDGDELFIADLGNHRIRRVDLQSGKIVTVAGTGKKELPQDGGLGVEQPLAGPRSLAVDEQYVWIVLREGNSLWRLERATGRIQHVAGTGEAGFSGDQGDARQATFRGPKGIAVDPGVALFVADTENHAIRKIDLQTGTITTVMGASGQAGFNGDGDEVSKRTLSRPHGVCLLPDGSLVVGDSENHRVRLLVH